MRIHIRTGLMLCLALTAILTPGAALADGPGPIAAPEGFAELRARFEGKSGDEIAAMGYVAEPPICVSEPGMGGMGVHALNFENFRAQFAAGAMDAQKPPVVLLDASLERVVGLEWEAADVGQGAPKVFGQPAILLPGHPGPPGTEVPHYMLHAYFRADGQVLFAPFDPEVTCPQMPDSSTRDVAWPVASLGLLIVLIVGSMVAAWMGLERRRLVQRRNER